MATIVSMGGDQAVNLCTALGGNVVTTNVAGRRTDYVAERPALMHIAGVSGSACSYLIEGSPDGTLWFPLPTQDIPIGTPGPPGTLTSAVIVGGASPISLCRLLPVDWPWEFVRVTMSANTATLNTIDVFIF